MPRTPIRTEDITDSEVTTTKMASTKTKLEALGLTVDEIKDAFGIE